MYVACVHKGIDVILSRFITYDVWLLLLSTPNEWKPDLFIMRNDTLVKLKRIHTLLNNLVTNFMYFKDGLLMNSWKIGIRWWNNFSIRLASSMLTCAQPNYRLLVSCRLIFVLISWWNAIKNHLIVILMIIRPYFFENC